MNISRHAALRYLERVICMDMQVHYDCMEAMGYPRDDIRQYFAEVHELNFEDMIMPDPVVRAAEINRKTYRSHRVEHDGFRYVLRASTLISVIAIGSRRPKTKRKAWKERFAEAEAA